MKESERLTKRGSDKVAFVLANAETGQLMRYVKPNLWLHGHYKGFIVDRLAAYEETGLSPEEVEKLKAENAELRARLEVSKLALESACRHIDEVGETCAVCIFSGTTNCVPYCNAVENMVRFFNEEAEVRLKELEANE